MTEVPTRDGQVIPLRASTSRLAALELENAQLREALRTRLIIEQAKGAISARLATTPDVAFEMMRGLARSQGRDVHAYAADVVANGGRLDV